MQAAELKVFVESLKGKVKQYTILKAGGSRHAASMSFGVGVLIHCLIVYLSSHLLSSYLPISLKIATFSETGERLGSCASWAPQNEQISADVKVAWKFHLISDEEFIKFKKNLAFEYRKQG